MADTTIYSAPHTGPRSLLKSLGEAERHWTVKAVLRTIICIVNLVAIGCAGFLLHGGLPNYSYGYYFATSSISALAAIVALSVSFIWCLCYIVIPLVRKPAKPLHPGIAVGFDLILFLGLIFICLLGLGAVFRSARYNYGVNRGTVNGICSPEFADCTEQDAYFDSFRRQRTTRFATTILVNTVEWLDLLLHFALFVWACIDTSRYNRRFKGVKEEEVTARVMADLERRGLLVTNNGTVRQPVGGYYTPTSGPDHSAMHANSSPQPSGSGAVPQLPRIPHVAPNNIHP